MRLLMVVFFAAQLAVACYATGAFGQTGSTANANASVYTTDPQAPPGSAKQPVRVSSGVMAGYAIRQDKPVYPPPPRCGAPLEESWKGSGVTVLHATINPEGKVDRLEFISGRKAFREPVMDAVRKWTYRPYLLNGTAAWVETTITLEVQMGCMP